MSGHRIAGIAALGGYLPERIVTNEEIARKFPDWNPARAERITGIRERRVEGEETPLSEMCMRAARNLFGKRVMDPARIDFVIVVTQSGDYTMPATACIVQRGLGISRSAGAMDINLGCSGYVYGLAVAKSLVEAGTANNVLLIAAEKTSFFMHPDDITLRVLQGDAASATLVSVENPIASVGITDFGTDGTGYADIILPYSGTAETREKRRAAEAKSSYPYPKHVNMKGMEIFNFSVGTVPETVRSAVRKNGLELGEIDCFLFHQANKIIVSTIADTLGIPMEKVPMNIETVGNTSSCSVPLLLEDTLQSRPLKNGARILLCGFGVGLSWATTVLTLR